MTSPAPSGPALPRISVDIWSDVVCPWCYIGKRRFERALSTLGDVADVSVRYRAFQLDPTAPTAHPEPVHVTYAKKFGGPERARQMIDNVTQLAAVEGLEFRLDRALRANTLLAHRLLALAADAAEGEPLGVTQADLKERLMRAYFVDAVDVGDIQQLANCVAEIGGDPAAALRRLATDDGLDAVRSEFELAGELGITAVPTYVINGRWAIPGAQDSETFATALGRIAERSAVEAT